MRENPYSMIELNLFTASAAGASDRAWPPRAENSAMQTNQYLWFAELSTLPCRKIRSHSAGNQQATDVYSATQISSRGLLLCGHLQHSVGSLFGMGPAMAVSLLRIAAAKSSTNICVPRDGRWSLRNYLFRSGARSGARLAACGCGPGGQGAGTYWSGSLDMEWHV